MKKVLVILTIILIILFIVRSLVMRPMDEPVQKRLKVHIIKPNGKAMKIKPELENELREKIPVGTQLVFDKQAELSIKPGASERRGIYFSFAVKTRNDQPVETLVSLIRNGQPHLMRRFDKKNYYRSFSKEIDFKAGDEVRISLKGKGVIIVNEPLLYRIIDKKDRKYVFAIALDTLRYDSIGEKRNGVSLTPEIDKLKADSVVFNNAYTQSSWTLASFASFFTGLYEFNHQVTRITSIEKSKPFLIEQIRNKFFTVNLNAGLWLEGKFGFSRGFDYFDVVSTPTDSYGGRVLFDRTIDMLNRSRIPKQFMFLHTYQIHSPFAPPEDYIKKLKLKVKEKNLDTYYYDKQYLSNFDPELPEEMMKLYEAEIKAFDDFYGNFVKKLKEMGIYNQSMIVFFTDHGEEFYEHKGWSHAHALYNELLKSPLFIKFPANQHRGKTIDTPVAIIDILPTVLDFTQIRHDRKVDGLSLMPLINGGEWKRKQVYASTSVTYLVKQIQPKFAIIDSDYKLIYNYEYSPENLKFFEKYGLPPKVDEVQIFDMKNDITEIKPITGKKFASIKKRYWNDVRRVKQTIERGMAKPRKSNIRFTEAEKKKLRSLGYL